MSNEIEEYIGQIMVLTDKYNNTGYFLINYIRDDLLFYRIGISKLEYENEKVTKSAGVNEVMLPYEKFLELKKSFITVDAFKLLHELRDEDN